MLASTTRSMQSLLRSSRSHGRWAAISAAESSGTRRGRQELMVFCVNKLRRDPRFGNPTIVPVTDRTDLDDQLAGTFTGTHLAAVCDEPVIPAARAVAGLWEKYEVLCALLHPIGFRPGELQRTPNPDNLFWDAYNLILETDERTRDFLDTHAALARWTWRPTRSSQRSPTSSSRVSEPTSPSTGLPEPPPKPRFAPRSNASSAGTTQRETVVVVVSTTLHSSSSARRKPSIATGRTRKSMTGCSSDGRP